ncbi:phytanoyl-CoA dioxygenase family protein [Streptomyces sp. NPDC059785]|uniref:phytanoyl-CoA dioxygenase family protein n=1 Tax=unclassified Streptomyces TaxID=2593676 RepID=UPI00364A0C2E
MPLLPVRSGPLSPKELYLFDTMGYLRMPGFISPATAEDCRAEVRTLPSHLMKGRGDKERFDDLTRHSARFDALARSEPLLDCVRPVINQPLRLIESYGLRRTGDSRFYLHNGFSEVFPYGRGRTARRNMSFQHTYHDGHLYCMFVKLLLYLTDVASAEDGPFCCLQGSHKANFPWFPDTKAFSRRPALTTENFPSLDIVPAGTGDALLLNEALFHGTLPKSTECERLVLAFSYAPAFVTDWAEIDVDSEDIAKVGHY